MIPIVKKGDKSEVEIVDMIAGGDGVAKIDGYPLFIKNAVTGDRLGITITKTNKSYGFAKNDGIIKKSPHRTNPPCPNFERCGGCDLMHTDYGFQLKLKESFVLSAMERIGGFERGGYIYDGIIGAENTLGYRNKAQFPVGMQKGRVVSGFYEKKSHDIVPCKNCLIQDEAINRAAELIVEYANENRVSVYDEKTHRGILRHIYIRRENGKGDIMSVIVTNSEKPLPAESALVAKLKTLGNVKCVIQNINTKKGNLILGGKNRVIMGDDHIVSKIGSLSFKISPESFFQVNGSQTQRLYEKALEFAGLSGSETVFDLYCGVGSISLFLAQRAKKVIGVEIVGKAVENARTNAELNGIKNASFYAGDCAEVVRTLINSGERADVVVVDPPRKGCSAESIELICEISPKRLVYVSCNCATLARDAKLLSQKGYTLERLCAVDMFPHTSHVECVGLLLRKETE